MKNILNYTLDTLKRYILKHKIFLLVFATLAVVARIYSNLDIYITNLFYRDNSFYLAGNKFGLIIYEGAYVLTVLLIIFLAVMLIINIITGKKILHLTRKAIIFISLSFILAPGIVVNGILKEHVGRPRPAEITVFGGQKNFQPPFKISKECETNCSFVSGHASFAFAFMVFGLLFKGVRRKIALSAGFLFGSIVGFVRIFQGRHFFYDVVFAFFFTWLTITLLYEFFYPDDELPDSLKS